MEDVALALIERGAAQRGSVTDIFRGIMPPPGILRGSGGSARSATSRQHSHQSSRHDAASSGKGSSSGFLTEFDLQSPMVDEECVVCMVCMDQTSTYSFMPCGHRCVCEDCFCAIMCAAQSCCPVCRTPALTGAAASAASAASAAAASSTSSSFSSRFNRTASRASRFRGVTWDAGKMLWEVRVFNAGAFHVIGHDREELVAARRYDAHIIHSTLDRPLNFPADGAVGADVDSGASLDEATAETQVRVVG